MDSTHCTSPLRLLWTLAIGSLALLAWFVVSLFFGSGSAAATPSEEGSPLDGVTSLVGSVTAPVAQIVAPVTAPVAQAVAPVTAPIAQAAAPVVAVPVAAVAPVAQAVAPVVSAAIPAPVAAAVTPVVRPAADLVASVTTPLAPVIAPVISPLSPVVDATLSPLVPALTAALAPLDSLLAPNTTVVHVAGALSSGDVAWVLRTVDVAAVAPTHSAVTGPVRGLGTLAYNDPATSTGLPAFVGLAVPADAPSPLPSHLPASPALPTGPAGGVTGGVNGGVPATADITDTFRFANGAAALRTSIVDDALPSSPTFPSDTTPD